MSSRFLASLKIRLSQCNVLAKALSVSVLNQAVSSLTNFILGLYLVRVLTPMEFGLYGIGLAISLFYEGIGNALFLTQMVVHTPDKGYGDRLPYAGRMLILVAIFSAATFLITGALLIVSALLWTLVAECTVLAFAVMSASITYLLKDFFIRHAYSVLKENRALGVNIVLAGSLLLILIIQDALKITTTAEQILFSMSGAYGISAIAGFVFSKLSFKRCSVEQTTLDCREAFRGGGWSVVAHLIISLRTQAHTLVVATFMGPIGIAKLNAAKIFVTPATMMTPALAQVFLPRVASARVENPAKGFAMGVRFAVLLLGIMLAYSIIILAVYPKISFLVVGNQYGSLFWLVLGWCIYSSLTALRSGQELTLIAFKLFKAQAFANVFAAALALLLVYLLVGYFQEFGAIMGLTVSEIAVILMMWRVTQTGLTRGSANE